MLENVLAFAGMDAGPALIDLKAFFAEITSYIWIIGGFSLVIFFHELGHYAAAKWCDVRVDKFAVGFGKAIASYRKGIGFRWGSTEEEYRDRLKNYVHEKHLRDLQLREKMEPTETELREAAQALKLGETEYSFNWLPLGGYVKMLGQEDFVVDKSGELAVREDPRAFTHKPVGQRMLIVSSGVVMNLVFACVCFMLVFMVGTDFPPARVGWVQMDSPAERAGLEPGDKILALNGREVADYTDLKVAVMLADPDEPMTIKYERPQPEGKPVVHEVRVLPERDVDQNVLKIGVAYPMNTTVALVQDDPLLPPDEQLKEGDKIVAVDGHPVQSLWGVHFRMIDKGGDWATLTVQRPVEGKPGEFQELQIRRRANLRFVPPGGNTANTSGGLLGLIPRRVVSLMNPEDRAYQAGIRSGDVIARWGNHVAPTLEEILESIAQNPEQDIPVTVLRQEPGKEARTLDLTVRPQAPPMFRGGKPKVGMDINEQETDLPVVADIREMLMPGVPNAAAVLKDKMPRGSRITHVNDQPVKNWYELVNRFVELAGEDVKLTWQYQDQPEQSATLHVPETLGTTFELPPGHQITKIAGKSTVEVKRNGRTVNLPVASWDGAREALSQHIGETIEIEHRGNLDRTPRTASVQVTPEMLDTWTLRVRYEVEFGDLLTQMSLEKVQETNPFKAMMIGVRKTYYFIEQVYVMMKRMLITQTVGIDQVSGPVGIVKMGSDIAKQDPVKLFYFLALLSANLAVINFMPLPIVDGGLFVFLIIEKIKGSPISLKVQMATQVIGLVLIIGIFLFVTFQDISKLIGS